MPSTEQIRDIGKWLEFKLFSGVFSTSALGAEESAFAPLTGVASGMVATRISSEDEMLIWFRASAYLR